MQVSLWDETGATFTGGSFAFGAWGGGLTPATPIRAGRGLAITNNTAALTLTFPVDNSAPPAIVTTPATGYQNLTSPFTRALPVTELFATPVEGLQIQTLSAVAQGGTGGYQVATYGGGEWSGSFLVQPGALLLEHLHK